MVLRIQADKAVGHSAISQKYFYKACLKCRNCYQKAPEKKVSMIIPGNGSAMQVQVKSRNRRFPTEGLNRFDRCS